MTELELEKDNSNYDSLFRYTYIAIHMNIYDYNRLTVLNIQMN